MKKSIYIQNQFANMRLDRWFKNEICNVPHSLIEKSIRKGRIKINNKKEKCSYKLKKDDHVILYNIDFSSSKNKIKTLPYKPTRSDLKSFLHNNYDHSRRLIVPDDTTLDVNEEFTILPQEVGEGLPAIKDYKSIGTTDGSRGNFIFTIENPTVIRFNRYYASGQAEPWESGGWFREAVTYTGRGIMIRALGINPSAFTTVTVVSVESKLKQVIGIKVNADSNATVNPMNSTVDVTNPKFY